MNMNGLRRKAKRRIEREYQRFRKTKLIHATKTEIWNLSHKIYFYSSIREYFDINGAIPGIYLELASVEPALIHMMWEMYLKEERLQFQTWEGIEEILEQVLLSWKVPSAA